MPDSHLIGPSVGSTPAALKTSRRGGRPLPDDLLREASRRLEIMLLLGAALWVIGPLVDHLVLLALNDGGLRGLQLHVDDAIAAINVVASLALVAYIRGQEHEPWRILDLGRGTWCSRPSPSA